MRLFVLVLLFVGNILFGSLGCYLFTSSFIVPCDMGVLLGACAMFVSLLVPLLLINGVNKIENR